jgi:hypothetical protein
MSALYKAKHVGMALQASSRKLRTGKAPRHDIAKAFKVASEIYEYAS